MKQKKKDEEFPQSHMEGILHPSSFWANQSPDLALFESRLEIQLEFRLSTEPLDVFSSQRFLSQQLLSDVLQQREFCFH